MQEPVQNKRKINIKKISIIISIVFGALISAQLMFTLIIVIGLKPSRFYISNISPNLQNGAGVDISIESNVFSPLSIKVPETVVTVGYVKDGKDEEILKARCDEISFSSFRRLGFSTTAFLEHCDLSKASDFGRSKEPYIDVTTKIVIKIFVIPVSISFTKKRIILPVQTEAEKYAPFFENFDKAKEYFSRYFSFEESRAQVAQLLPSSSLAAEGSGAVVPKNKILKSFSPSEDENFFIFEIVLEPMFHTDYVRNLDFKLENLSVFLSKPFSIEIHLDLLYMNESEYIIKLRLKKFNDRLLKDVIIDFATIAWGEEFLFIQFDKILHNGHELYDSRRSTDTRGLITISSETSILDSPCFQFVLKDLIIDADRVSIDLSLCANVITSFLSGMIHLLLQNYSINADISLNDHNVGTLRVKSLNPVETLEVTGRYFKLFKLELFLCPNLELLIKCANEIRIQFKEFTGILKGLNSVTVVIPAAGTPLLKIGKVIIDGFLDPMKRSRKKIKKPAKYEIFHKIDIPDKNELLSVSSSFANVRVKNVLRKYNLWLKPLSYTITCNKIALTQGFCQDILLIFEPSEIKTEEGNLFGSFSCVTKLYEVQSKISTASNIFYELIGEQIIVQLTNKEERILKLMVRFDKSIPELFQSPGTGSGLSGFNIIPLLSGNWNSKPNTLRMSLRSEITSLKALIDVHSLENEAIVVNSIELPSLQATHLISGIPLDFKSSPIRTEVALCNSTVFVYFVKQVELCVDIKEGKNEFVAFVPSRSAESATGDIWAKIKGQPACLSRLINFASSIDVSKFQESAKLSPVIPTVNSKLAISLAFVFEETPDGNFHVESKLEFPLTMFEPLLIANVGFLQELSVRLITNSQIFESAISIDKTKLALSVSGRIDVRTEKFVFELRTKNITVFVFEIVAADIFNFILSKSENDEDDGIKEMVDPQDASARKPFIHISPVTISAVSKNITKFAFDIFPEAFERQLGQFSADLLRNLPFKIHPKDLFVNFKIGKLPSFSITKGPDVFLTFDGIETSFSNTYPILYTEPSYTVADKAYLAKLYADSLYELDHFEANNQEIYIETFQKPIRISFVIDTHNSGNVVITSGFSEEAKLVISQSGINYLYFNLLKRPALESLQDKPIEPPKPKGDVELKIWLTIKNYGALIFKSSSQLNFIRSPFSIFVLVPGLLTVQMRLFGLQKDLLLENNNQFNGTIPFLLIKYEKSETDKKGFNLGSRKGGIFKKKDSEVQPNKALKIFALYNNQSIRIMESSLDMSVTDRVSLILALYFSSVGKKVINAAVSAKNALFFWNKNKGIRTNVNKEKTIQVEVIENSRDKWTGEKRYTELKSLLDQERERLMAEHANRIAE